MKHKLPAGILFAPPPKKKIKQKKNAKEANN